MGIITSPGNNLNPVVVKFLGHSKWLSWILLLLGIVFVLVMPHQEFSHKTYFSENALLPGLVKNHFNQDLSAQLYLEKMREEAAQKGDISMKSVHRFLSDLGLEVYWHNFTLNFPFGSGKQFHGQNLYAILRAPRASSTEALVLSAPFRRTVSLEPPNDVGLALLLASAKFFKGQAYWAKDIIFLITEHEMLGMQAWLEAYHQTTCGTPGVVDHGDLEGRAGAIQAAINLEFSQDRITHINVKIQGLNGQLPNLDLFNLINRLCMKDGVGQLFQNREELLHRGSSSLGSWKGYQSSLKTLLSMMADQASGMVNGNHGLFHRLGIEALTIEGVDLNNARKRKKRRYQEVDIYQMGRIIEGTFRSLNNLLERFHQSFFYYVLPSSSRYVSIGMYMPGFGCLAAALVLPALSLWLSLGSNTSPCVTRPDIYSTALPLFLTSHGLGILAFVLPLPTSQLNAFLKLNLHYEHAIVYGVIGLSAVGLLTPMISRVDGNNVKIIKCLTLLELAAVSFTVSLSNFSLSYLLTAFVIGPLTLLVTPSKGIKRVALSCVALLAHPLVLSFILSIGATYRLDGKDLSFLKVILKGYQTTEHAIMYSIIDSFIYGNVTYSLCCLSYLPIWSLCWSIIHMA